MGDKDRFNLSIDKELLAICKKKYPRNLSEIIVDDLINRLRFGADNLLELDAEINSIRDQINSLSTQLEVLEYQRKELYRENSGEKEVKESVWMQYRIEHTKHKIHGDYEYMDKGIVKDAETTLGYSSEELLKIYDFFMRKRNDFDCPLTLSDRWVYVEPEWLKYVGS